MKVLLFFVFGIIFLFFSCLTFEWAEKWYQVWLPVLFMITSIGLLLEALKRL